MKLPPINDLSFRSLKEILQEHVNLQKLYNVIFLYKNSMIKFIYRLIPLSVMIMFQTHILYEFNFWLFFLYFFLICKIDNFSIFRSTQQFDNLYLRFFSFWNKFSVKYSYHNLFKNSICQVSKKDLQRSTSLSLSVFK